jgi:redox-sensitive bicupin YhaK (pirin superfamily)
LPIQQDTNVYAGPFDGEESASLTLDKNRHAYVHLARGSVELNDVKLEAGDGVRLRNPETLQLSTGKDAEVLVFDLRPNELP